MPPPNKKRRIMPLPKSKGDRPEEINFDLGARQDYLTGFHKRKVQRTKAAQEVAERRAKEERRQQRQKLREDRKRELEERVKIVDAYIKPPSKDVSDGENSPSEDGSDNEQESEVPEPVLEKVDHEAEYVDEDKYTSVVVEEVDVDRDGFVGADEPSGDEHEQATITQEQSAATKEKKTTTSKTDGKRRWTFEKPKDAASKAKKKKKKFRYESKAERKMERVKQRGKNSKQAKARREQ